MRIATWNVNSIRTRLPRLLGVLQRHQPDAVCIQELKVAEDEFPSLELKAAGYEAALAGQKSYNAAALAGIRVLCVYVPNGGEVALRQVGVQARVARPPPQLSRPERGSETASRRLR